MTRLRVRHLRALVPFVAIGWIASLPLGDNSFLWHVRAGTVQLRAGEVLRVDPFSATATGAPWRTQSWLAELGYGWLEGVSGGIGWVPIMKFVVITVTVALIALAVYRSVGGNGTAVLVATLVVVWQAAPFAVARPALLGYLLLAVVIALTSSKRRAVWLIPAIIWLWAAIHATFALGLVYLALDGWRRRSRKQLIAVIFGAGAAGLTAHGLGIWWILLQFFRSRGALEFISEWQPPDFSNPFLLPFLVVVIALLVAAVLGRLSIRDLIVVVPFVVFGLIVERNVYPSLLVLAPFAARAAIWQRATAPSSGKEPVALNWAVAAVLVVLTGVGLLRPLELKDDRFPSDRALAAVDSGPLLHGTAVGGYLIYRDWPGRLVFIDDRAELYGREGFQRFHDLRLGSGGEAALEELGIDQVLAQPDWPLVDVLLADDWTERYRDENFVVLHRP